MILRFDGKIMKQYTRGKNLTRDSTAVSMNCEGENMLHIILPCVNSTLEYQRDVTVGVLESYGLKN